MISLFRGKESLTRRMKRIAIIPARSGSKGLKDKNIAELNGKPLMAYTIEAARESGCFDYVMVSTDSEKYAEIACRYGAEIPFLRGKASSSDQASSWSVVREVLDKLRQQGICFDELALLQPTSPLRTAEDIRQSFALYEEKDAISVVSVCEVAHPLEWSFTMDASCSMDSYAKSPNRKMRRQDIPTRYIANGAIYLTKTKICEKDDIDIYAEKCYAYVMPADKSCDIDTKLDLMVAETILNNI